MLKRRLNGVRGRAGGEVGAEKAEEAGHRVKITFSISISYLGSNNEVN
jgi:hypothetical protein